MYLFHLLKITHSFNTHATIKLLANGSMLFSDITFSWHSLFPDIPFFMTFLFHDIPFFMTFLLSWHSFFHDIPWLSTLPLFQSLPSKVSGYVVRMLYVCCTFVVCCTYVVHLSALSMLCLVIPFLSVLPPFVQ